MSANKLPDGWTRVRLGEVITRTSKRCTPEVSPSVRWIGADHLEEGDLSVRRWSTTDDPMFPPTFYFSVPSGSVLLHSRNPKKVAILPFDAITGEKLFCLAPVDASALDCRFLAYQLQSDHFHEFVGRWLSGSVNKFLNWTALARYEFAFPPIEQQHRIVEVLAQAESVVEKSSRAVLVAKTALNQMSIQLTRPTDLPSMPLESAAEVLDSRRIPVSDSERSKRVGSVPYYGANGQVGVIDTAIFNEPLVLVPEDGGRFSEWRSNPVAYRIDGPSWVNNHAHVLKARGIPHGWLYFSLRNLDMTHLVVGTTRTKLNRSSLSKIVIAAPEDLASRLELLERADAVRGLAEKHLEGAKRIFSELRNKLVAVGGHEYVQ